MKSETRLQLDSFDNAVATLTTTATIKQWKDMVGQANNSGGNFYILHFKWEIQRMLEEAEARYLDSAKDAKRAARLMAATTDASYPFK